MTVKLGEKCQKINLIKTNLNERLRVMDRVFVANFS
jgi:hypothetical protein